MSLVASIFAMLAVGELDPVIPACPFFSVHFPLHLLPLFCSAEYVEVLKKEHLLLAFLVTIFVGVKTIDMKVMGMK